MNAYFANVANLGSNRTLSDWWLGFQFGQRILLGMVDAALSLIANWFASFGWFAIFSNLLEYHIGWISIVSVVAYRLGHIWVLIEPIINPNKFIINKLKSSSATFSSLMRLVCLNNIYYVVNLLIYDLTIHRPEIIFIFVSFGLPRAYWVSIKI